MIFDEGLMQYFYYKRLAEREREKQEDLQLRHLRNRGMLIHLGITEDKAGEKMLRTDGGTICGVCDKTHREHPYIDDVLSFDGTPFLHAICNGDLAKL